jgi:hypothetical protein
MHFINFLVLARTERQRYLKYFNLMGFWEKAKSKSVKILFKCTNVEGFTKVA